MSEIVTAQSARHMHYIMTCLSGDFVVLVTITVTTRLIHEGDTVPLLVLALCAPLSTMGLVTL